jgi:hypothetical protein
MKSSKKIVDILMMVFIVLSLLRWDGDPTFHIVVGSVCVLLFIVHFLLNLKPFIAMTKKLRKLKLKIKLQYLIDLILIIVWSSVIITGFVAIPSYIREEAALHGIGRIHGVFARVGCGIVLIHILQHLRQIRSYFKHRN